MSMLPLDNYDPPFLVMSYDAEGRKQGFGSEHLLSLAVGDDAMLKHKRLIAGGSLLNVVRRND